MVSSLLLVDIFGVLGMREDGNRRNLRKEIFFEEIIERENVPLQSKSFERQLTEEDETFWLNAEGRNGIKEEFGGYNTALVLGGFAGLFVLTCFLWTGLVNFRASRERQKIEKMKMKLVTKL